MLLMMRLNFFRLYSTSHSSNFVETFQKIGDHCLPVFTAHLSRLDVLSVRCHLLARNGKSLADHFYCKRCVETTNLILSNIELCGFVSSGASIWVDSDD